MYIHAVIVNEVGFERTEYTVSEDDGFLPLRVTLFDINLNQSSDITLGELIMASASSSDGTATGKSL